MRFQRISLTVFIPLLSIVSLPSTLNFPASLSVPPTLAQTQDTREAEAVRLLKQGVEQYHTNQLEAASQSLQQAWTIYREIQDRQGEWFALYFLGTLYSSVRDFTKGMEYLQQSLVIAREIEDRQKEWDALNGVGGAYASSGDSDKAIEYYQQSLTVARTIPDRNTEAQALENLSDAYKVLRDDARSAEYQQQRLAIVRKLGEMQADGAAGDEQERAQRALKEGQQLMLQGTRESLRGAIAKYEEAISLFRAVGDPLFEATTLLSIGSAYFDLGQKQKALNYYNQVLPLSRALDQPLFEATTLLSIGRAYSDLGQKQKALDYYNQALPILRAVGDRSGEATILNNIGSVYFDLAKYPQALDYYNQSLPLVRAVQDRSKEASTLNNIGLVYSQLGEYQQALDYYNQALPLLRAVRERFSEAATLDNIGTIYFFLGQKQKALDYFNQALRIEREAGDRSKQASTLANIGTLYSDLGDNQKALDSYNQALLLLQAVGDRFEEATMLSNIGAVYFDLGENQKALDHYNRALSLSRDVGNQIEEATTLAKVGQVYYALKDYAKATEYLQQSLVMARQIGERRVEGRILNTLGRVFFISGKLAAAEITLLDGIKVWESIRAGLGSNDINKISIFEEQAVTYRLLQKALIAQNKTDVALEIAERGRARAFVELLAGRLAANSSAPPTTKLLTIQQIQKIAKAQNATLIEYSIIYDDLKFPGPRKPQESELFIWVIKPTGEVAFRPVDLKSLNTPVEDLVTSSRDSISVRSRGSIELQPIDEVSQTQRLKQLHQLLIQPIADLLPNHPNARVIFLPQNELFLIPFPALQDASGKYLIEKHTILTAPAIQVLDLTHRQRQQVSGKDVLVVGNPIMPSVPFQIGDLPQQLPSLPYAEQEAKAIAHLLNTKALIGNLPTKSSVVQQLPRARMIHLATHGLLDDFEGLGVPGAIALAPFGNDNGLLTANEILDLKLNAELVVLSACDTGRGRITGDGVIGLSRSLITAGVPSVIVSLWSVPDAPTADLMTEFYRTWQERKLDKAQALRQAMLTTMKSHPNPRNWAPFTLIGEAD